MFIFYFMASFSRAEALTRFKLTGLLLLFIIKSSIVLPWHYYFNNKTAIKTNPRLFVLVRVTKFLLLFTLYRKTVSLKFTFIECLNSKYLLINFIHRFILAYSLDKTSSVSLVIWSIIYQIYTKVCMVEYHNCNVV